MDAADAGMGAEGNPEQGTVPDSSSRSEDPTQHAKAALYGAAFAVEAMETTEASCLSRLAWSRRFPPV